MVICYKFVLMSPVNNIRKSKLEIAILLMNSIGLIQDLPREIIGWFVVYAVENCYAQWDCWDSYFHETIDTLKKKSTCA